MTEEKGKAYSLPDDANDGLVSEPLLNYSGIPSDCIVLRVPKGHDVDRLRTKIIAYYNILLSDDDETEKRFHELLENWRNETVMLSSISKITDNESFKQIVALGEKVVPFILAEIETNPSNLVWALNMIYNKRISDNRNISITESCRLWVSELKKR